MIPSQYAPKVAEAFQSLGIVLERDLILIEVPPKGEIKTASGIIVADNSKNQVNTLGSGGPILAHAICIGKGYTQEDGSPDPLTTRIGDVLLISPHSVEWIERFPGLATEKLNETKIGLIKEGSIQINLGQYPNIGKLESLLKGTA